MKVYSCKTRVLREDKRKLIVICDCQNRAPIGPLQIYKKHILEGSDNLGIPDPKDEEDERQRLGELVLPKWRATQLCLWDNEDEKIEQEKK